MTNTKIIIEKTNGLLRALKVDAQGNIIKFFFVPLASTEENVIQSTVASLLSKIEANGDEVILILRQNVLSSRYLCIPSIKEKEVEEILKNILPAEFPYSEEDISYGYIFSHKTKTATYLSVFVTDKNKYKAFTDAFELQGCPIKEIYSDVVALPEIALKAGVAQDKEVLLIYLFSENAVLSILRNGKITVCRSVLFSRNDCKSFLREVQKTLKYYCAYEEHGPINEIYLASEKEDYQILNEFLSKNTAYKITEIKSESILPQTTDILDFRFATNMASILTFAKSPMPATAALTCKEHKAKVKINNLSNDLKSIAVSLLIALIMLNMSYVIRGVKESQALTNIKTTSSTKAEKAEILEAKKEKIVQATQAADSNILLGEFMQILLSVKNPVTKIEEVYYSSQQTDSRFTIIGRAETAAAVSSYVEELVLEGEFSPSDIKVNNLSTDGKKEGKVNFEITVR